MQQRTKVLSGPGDKVFSAFLGVFTVFLIVVTVYPLIYVFSMAISDPVAVSRKEVWLFPVGFSSYALETVFEDPNVLTYYGNTIWYTVVGVLLGIITTSLAAYPLSRRTFAARKPIMWLITFTMFFSGGMIPTYLVVARFLGLYNSRWAIILPGLTSAWYVIVARTFFMTIPEEMLESAKIDGAGEFRLFLQFVMPLSAPILAVLALYYGIGHWNAYFNAMLYLGKTELQPLALYVRRVVIQNSLEVEPVVDLTYEQVMSTLQIKYAVIVVAVVPILCLYPFLAKYLEKGMLVGSLKG
ncbi:MAG TPA: carbohydrate ABC transporter permease [Candidatus Faecivicinus avistercoris]|nr:carbohydrate ABC transporter permease [Candidatus Faecivicinus avistercoris]